jgi:SAM-dependent methyltransferase
MPPSEQPDSPITTAERWEEGDAYERFMGRWSRPVAERFVDWLAVRPGAGWLDVGCGTGALLATIQGRADPHRLAGVDPSAGFLATAGGRLAGRAELAVADAQHLPFGPDEFGATVSGLVLNFVPDPLDAVRAMRRVTRPGGVVAAYVWDYAEGMAFLRLFWDVVTEFDPAAEALDEGLRFPLCRPEPLRELFASAGLSDVDGTAIEVQTAFAGFDDYWQPFLAGQGPAAGYVAQLPPERREALASGLRSRLPVNPDGSIDLAARAWAVRGYA